ncbi:MAG: SPOR domain-containing protein [Pseudomonadota bacterium]
MIRARGYAPLRFAARGPAGALLLAATLFAQGCMPTGAPVGGGDAPAAGSVATAPDAATLAPAPLPGTAALPDGFVGPILVEPAVYGRAYEGPVFSGLEPRPDIFEARQPVRWKGGDTLAGIWIAHPAARRAIRARFINPRTDRAADGALIPRAGAEAPLLSKEAAEALEIRPYRTTEIVIVAVDLPTVIAVGEPGAADETPAEGDDAVAVAEAAPAPDGSQATAEPAFLSEAEAAIDSLQGPVAEPAPPPAETPESQQAFAWIEEDEAEALPDRAEPEQAPTAAQTEEDINLVRKTGSFALSEADADPAPEPAALPTAASDPVETADAPTAETPVPEPEIELELARVAAEEGDNDDLAEREPRGAATADAPATEPEAEPEPQPDAFAWAEDASTSGTARTEPGTFAWEEAPAEASAVEPEAPARLPPPEPPEPQATGTDKEEESETVAVAAAPAAEPLARPFLQAGVFSVEQNARRVIATLRNEGHDGRISTVTLASGPAYRVVAGPFETRAARRDGSRVLRRLGIRDAVPTAR